MLEAKAQNATDLSEGFKMTELGLLPEKRSKRSRKD